MKLILTSSWLAAVLCSAWPAAAQPAEPHRIERSIVRESRRLALMSTASTQTGPAATDPRWVPVRMLPGGVEVEVWARNAPPAQRVFVSADNTSITVLNLIDPALPSSARRVLRNLAKAHPGTLLSPDQMHVEDGVTLDRAGVSMGSRLLTSRDHLIEQIARDDLRQLRFNGPGGSYWGRGLLVGLAAGALIAYAIGSSCGPGAAQSECSFYGLVFMPVGAGLGAAAGAGLGASVDRPSARVVYSAP
jgi:hypothetical protein